METFHGYPVRHFHVPIGGRMFDILSPADHEALLEHPDVVARFAADEYMPYWATLWPAALVLADEVALWAPPAVDDGRVQVVEIGAGLGLVGLVALWRGWRVLISDYDEHALAFIQENARRNELPAPETRYIDWRERHAELQPTWILAADVLYERRHLEPVAQFVAQHLAPDGTALISDANRSTADAFPELAQRAGLTVTVHQCPEAELPGGLSKRGRVFRLQRA